MDVKQTNLVDGKISVLDGSSSVYGNESLSNRFRTIFMMDGEYGGNAKRLIGLNIVKSDLQLLAGAISSAIEDTVDSMITNQDILPPAERIVDAWLDKLTINDDAMVVAEIEIIPEEKEKDLWLRLPIAKRRL